MLNMVGKLIRVDKSIAAGIDKFDKAIIDPQRDGDSVARNAGHILHDADPFADQRIEEATLTDVGAANDRNLRELRHGGIVGGHKGICNYWSVVRCQWSVVSCPWSVVRFYPDFLK